MSATAQFHSFGPFHDNNGDLITAPRIYHYIVGSATLKDGWTTRDKAQTIAQPLVGDANGIASGFFDGLYKIVVKDSGGTTYYTWDNWSAGLYDGSFVNVLDYGAVGDGVEDDTTAVQAAVAAAYAAESIVIWPPGSYLTTASIPNLHDVRHRGTGVILRSSNSFYPDPDWGYTNNLYVATTGSNSNDGLSSSQPRLTVQSMGDVIYNYPYADAVWKINIAAGTYGGSVSFSKAFPTPNRVQFLGATVSRGVQPTTIVQSTGTGQNGFYFQNNVRAQVSNINFKSFRAAASPSANSLNSGIIVDARSEVYTDNVWTDDCDQGIYVANGSQIRLQAGRHGYNAINGNGVQLIRQSHATIGYSGTAADVTGATGPAFIGGTYGVVLQEFSMAHTDYCYFSAQTNSGVFLTMSRVHSVSSTYNSCLVGIDGRLNSNIGHTSNTFTSCGTDMIFRSGTRDAGVSSPATNESTDFGPSLYEYDAVGGSTQSATPVTLYTKSFEAKEFQNRGAGFKLRLYGEVVGVANTKTITVTLGATTLLTATIAAATTDYWIDIRFFNTTAASAQKCLAHVHQNGVTPTITYNNAIAEDITTAKTLTVTHQVTNVADLNRIGVVELEMIH